MYDPFRCEKCRRQLDIGDWPFCPHGSAVTYIVAVPQEIQYDLSPLKRAGMIPMVGGAGGACVSVH